MKNKLRILKNEKGVTLVETMTAVAILAIIVVPLLSGVIASVNNNAVAKEKTEAIALAEMAMGSIKAQAALSVATTPAISTEFSQGKFDTYIGIKEINPLTLTKSNTNYTYDAQVIQKVDFEITVDQSKLDSNDTVDITVKDFSDNVVGSIIDINTKYDTLELKIEKTGTDYTFNLNKGGSAGITKNFTPQKYDTIKKAYEISLRVTYVGKSTGTAKLFKIDTYDNSPGDDTLIIYIVDSFEHKPGVDFIPKGIKDTVFIADIAGSINNNSVINKLYEVTVIVKKKYENKEIYKVASYVKK